MTVTSTRARKPLRYWTFLPGIVFFLLTLPLEGYAQNTSSNLRIFQHGSGTPTGKDVGMFPESPTRKKLDLSGTWQYSFDAKVWRDVQVPSAFDYTGSLVLRREFDVAPGLLDRRLFYLVLYGINYQSEVTINGIFVGRHTGGYTSLVIPVPGNVLQAGPKNVITVSIDNTLSPRTTVPQRQQVGGWKTYAGIYRDIYLLATPDISIGEIGVVAEYAAGNKNAKLAVSTDVLSGPGAAITDSGGALYFAADVVDRLTGEPVAASPFVRIAPEPGHSVRVTSSVTLPAPKLWSPEFPDLYVVRCRDTSGSRARRRGPSTNIPPRSACARSTGRPGCCTSTGSRRRSRGSSGRRSTTSTARRSPTKSSRRTFPPSRPSARTSSVSSIPRIPTSLASATGTGCW